MYAFICMYVYYITLTHIDAQRQSVTDLAGGLQCDRQSVTDLVGGLKLGVEKRSAEGPHGLRSEGTLVPVLEAA